MGEEYKVPVTKAIMKNLIALEKTGESALSRLRKPHRVVFM
jgi:hypothetical protein